MKSVIRTVFSFTLCGILIFIYGCSNDNPTSPVQNPTIISVSGKVIGTFGNPLSNLTVLIGTQTAITDGNGNFTINNVTTPYDVYVLVTGGVFEVKGLTIANPFLPGEYGGLVLPRLMVHIPAIPNGSGAVAIFTDTIGNISGSSTIDEITGNANINLGGNTGQVVSGKVYVLQYNINNNVITSYTRYGEQQVTFTLGTSTTVTFTNQQLSTSTGQSTVSGTVNSPAGYAGLQSQLYINFGNKNNLTGKGCFIQSINGNAFNFNVPTGTTTPPKINVIAATTTPMAQRMATLNAGTAGAVINVDTVPSLLTPPDGASNIDTTTVFTFTNGSSIGIHSLVFFGGIGGKFFEIFTKETTTRIPNLAAQGYPLGHNVQYQWDDSKVYDFNSVDVLFSQYINGNSSARGSGQSSIFHFTTKP